LVDQLKKVGRRERKKLERHDQILTCAMELFERDGYDAVSVEAIATAADISLRTLYNFFPTKIDLLRSGSTRKSRMRLETILASLTNPPLDVRVGLNRWIEAQFQVFAHADRDLLSRSVCQGLAQGPGAEADQEYFQIDSVAQSGLRLLLDIYIARGALPPDVEVGALVRLIFAASNGEFYYWVSRPDESVDNVLQRMRSHIDIALRPYLLADN
jgi:AcrR family transcriptional regulator